MRLPNPDRAVVEIEKFRGYCLNPQHEDGQHKARVFASALRLTRTDAAWLRERRLAAAGEEATLVGSTRFGSLYMVDSELETPAGRAIVRSGWIVRTGEDFPRLTTCCVKSNP